VSNYKIAFPTSRTSRFAAEQVHLLVLRFSMA
jgi:hypothetical protein